VPQAPQLAGSVCSLTHMPPQQLWPAGQSPCVPHVQEPLWQVSPEAQTCPQVPQLPVSVCRLVSQPLAALPSQLSKPALHAAMTQVPLEQAALALGKAQTCPHDPQLLASLLRSLQLPLQQAGVVPEQVVHVAPPVPQALVVFPG
jgi:hypothetical protein